MNSVDKAQVLDLLTSTDANRRSDEATVVISAHATQRESSAAMFHKEEASSSALRQAMARLTHGNPSACEQARQLDAYVRLLVDNHLDSGSGENALSMHRPRKRTSAAPTPHPPSTGPKT